MKKYTLYNAWAQGHIGNQWQFQTSIFTAYRYADAMNQLLLESIYPEWFIDDCKMIF